MSKGEKPSPDGLGEAAVSIDPNKDHRKRARARFNAVGGEALENYELLELLLFALVPQRDTKKIAKDLLRKFGSLAEVLAAPPARLKEIDYIGETVVTGLKVVEATTQRIARDKIDRDLPILGSWTALIDYCHAQMAFNNVEQFRILFLDKKNRLIADEVQGQGTVDHTPVYVREVVKRALELSSTAIVLVHNHPSGDPTPSRADIDMTRMIVDAGRPLGVTVHDHVIVGRDGHASFKAMRLI